MATRENSSHGKGKDITRRQLLRNLGLAGTFALSGTAILSACGGEGSGGEGSGGEGAQQAMPTARGNFNEWGFPQPYQEISQASVDWLKSKGWWPLQVAWNSGWSEEDMILFTMKNQEFLEKRGIEVEWTHFLAAAFMNEAFIPGQIQVAQAGSLGLMAAMGSGVPTVALNTIPAAPQGYLVPPDSPLESLQDLKEQKVLGHPANWAVTFGSTNHLSAILAASALGLEQGRDYVLQNTTPEDIITLPQGIDVTGIWEPNVQRMSEINENARLLQWDYFLTQNGYGYIRGEIEENAPDVVQAYVDAFVESQLWMRRYPDEAVANYQQAPESRGKEPELIRGQAELYNLSLKPTKNYIYDGSFFWAPIEAFNSQAGVDAGILEDKFSEDDFRKVFGSNYMADTYDRLGWAVPESPPFIPDDWDGEVGEPPYSPWGPEAVGKQEFPEPSDLTREWKFGGETYGP